MSADLASKFVVGSSTFSYASPYEIEVWQQERLSYRIPTGDTPGADGEYQEDGPAEARIVTLRGKLMAADGSPDTIRTYLETLAAAHTKGLQGKLYRNSDRYLLARVAYIETGEIDGLPSNEWEIGFRATPPWWYDNALTGPVALASGGGVTSVTAGGTVNARPAITLVVTAPGVVTLAAAGTGQQMVLTADAAGTYVLNSDGSPEPTALLSATDVLSKVLGEFLELIPGTANVSVTLSGGATLSSASLSYRRCYAVG